MTTTVAPAPHQIARIWSERQRLNVPMRGWWADPVDEDNDTPAYGMEVAPEALTDSDADWMTFDWDAVNGWTMTVGCDPGPDRSVLLDVADPFDAPAVAECFRKVITGEVDEFRGLPQ